MIIDPDDDVQEPVKVGSGEFDNAAVATSLFKQPLLPYSIPLTAAISNSSLPNLSDVDVPSTQVVPRLSNPTPVNMAEHVTAPNQEMASNADESQGKETFPIQQPGKGELLYQFL